MTVNTEENRKSFAGNGVTVAFSTPFFLADEDLLVLLVTDATGAEDPQLLNTDYTVTGAANPSGGTVTFTTAPASGVTVVILVDPPLTQLVSLVPNDPLPVETAVERPMDKLTLIAQRDRSLIERSLRLPDGDTGFVAGDMDLPPKVERASKSLAFNTDGEPIAAAGSVDEVPTTPFSQTLLDDETEAEARATLGAASQGDLDAAEADLAKVWTTGDVKLTFKATADAGWAMMDDGSIGSASSGATTRANADTEDLYALLWNNVTDTWAPVSGGRGASAAEDFAAGKTLTLPQALGRALAVAGAGSGLTSRALGETLGEEAHALTAAENGPHAHTGSTDTDGTHAHTIDGKASAGSGIGTNMGNASGGGADVTSRVDGAHSHAFTTGSSGSGTAHNNMQPSSFFNVMIKL